MPTPAMPPWSAYLIAREAAEVGVPLADKALLESLPSDRKDARLAMALRRANSSLYAAAQGADTDYKDVVDRVAHYGLSLPARPKDVPSWSAWMQKVRALVGQVASAAADPTVSAAFAAGTAAGDMYFAMKTGKYLCELLSALPENTLLQQRAIAVDRPLRDAAGRLLEAVRHPAAAQRVPPVAARLDALFQNIPSLAAVTSKESFEQLDNWTNKVVDELIELGAAIEFPPELPVTGPPTAAERALLAEICAHPEDNARRLRFAELAAKRNDPRAELISVQFKIIALKQQIPPGLDVYQNESRAKALIKFHPEWAEEVLRLGVRSVAFYRGFVGLIEIDTLDFLRNAEAIYQLAPVQHLQLRNAAGHLGELAASDHLDRIRSLILKENGLVDADVAALVASPRVRGLRLLDLAENKLSNAAVVAIAASPNLGSLRYLNVNSNPCDDPTDGQIYFTETQWGWTPRKFGQELEAKYGPKPYFHFPTDNWIPDIDQLWFLL